MIDKRAWEFRNGIQKWNSKMEFINRSLVKPGRLGEKSCLGMQDRPFTPQSELHLLLPFRLTFDKDSKRYEDILTVHGFFQCVQHTMRLEQFGLLFLGVPCNSFSWMSSSQHQRGESNGFMGNTSYEWVELMNAVAVRAAICIAIALSRKCYFMIENPRQSTLPDFPYYGFLLTVAKTLDGFAGNTTHRCVYWCLGSKGLTTQI